MANLYCFSGNIKNIIYLGGGIPNGNIYNAKVGDKVCISVLLQESSPEIVAIVIESYGTMVPSRSLKDYYNSPDDWCYYSDSTRWVMKDLVFIIESDSSSPF